MTHIRTRNGRTRSQTPIVLPMHPLQTIRTAFVTLVALALLAVSALVFNPSPASSQEQGPDRAPGAVVNSFETVQVIYAGFFGRGPTGAEVAAWNAGIAAGKSEAQLIAELEGSADQANIVGPIFRLYQAYFLRQPDPVGLAYWIQTRRSGVSLARIAGAFEASDEFKNRYGAQSTAGFVDLLYQNILRRTPEASGRAYWNNVIRRRQATRGEVVIFFSEAPEFINLTGNENRAALLYSALFGRIGSPTEIATWKSALDSGTTYQSAVQTFLSSSQHTSYRASLTVHPLTGVITRAPSARPALAFKIDNHANARPQSVIDRADIVVEEEVEFQLTRYIAIFHSDVPDRVGPIRSVRTSDFDVLAAYNRPMLGASGANPTVLSLLDGAGVENVTAGRYPKSYYRDNFKRAPHNLYAKTGELLAKPAPASGVPQQMFSYGNATGGVPVSSFQTNWGNSNSAYQWDAGQGGWVRYIGGTVHKTREGVAIAPENVVVQIVEYGVSAADANSPEAHTVGSGQVWVFTQGKYIQGTWSRSSAAARTVLTDGAGREILLTPGNTWVALLRSGGLVING